MDRFVLEAKERMGEDLEVIRRVQRGELAAFEGLVRKYEPKIRGFCANILLDGDSAKDAAQEVFLKAYQSVQTFRGDSSFSTWLYRIAVNHCRDMLRQRKRRFFWQTGPLEESEPPQLLTDLSSLSETTEQRNLLEQLLKQLSADHREVLVLREGHDLSYEQIAAALGCSLDAVKARIKRARKELIEHSRHLMRGDDVDTDDGGRPDEAL